ncbi:MAG: TlpA disulfide reductase family protein [Hyphomicrobium sp.]
MFNPESPPELSVTRWFNSEGSQLLAETRGKVTMIAVFQMLCPASVKHGLPQAARIASGFNDDQVAVIGLHSVFENHDKQTPDALEAFIDEHGFPFAIAADEPNAKGLPKTFSAYELQGTPTVLLFDRQGRLRRHYLGAVDDVRLAAEVMALTMEPADAPREVSLALERRLAIALVDPDAHDHDHGGGCCGGGGHHHHDNDEHSHGGGGCCGGGAHSHDHDHGHAHGHSHDHQQAKAKSGGGCGSDNCGCG